MTEPGPCILCRGSGQRWAPLSGSDRPVVRTEWLGYAALCEHDDGTWTEWVRVTCPLCLGTGHRQPAALPPTTATEAHAWAMLAGFAWPEATRERRRGVMLRGGVRVSADEADGAIEV